MGDDPFPVEWTGRQAVVAFPGNVDVSNVGQLRDRLLSVINRGAAVLIADMTDTASCDHSAVEAVARACQRAAISGTQVRLVVTAPAVRRVLSIEGLDRLVSIYPSLEAATGRGLVGSEPRPAGRIPRVSAPGAGTITPAVLWQLLDALGDGLALTDHEGKIALANRRCAEMFGYKREELIGLPVDSLVPSDVQAAHRRYRAGYQQAPQARPMAERVRLAGLRKDGATLPVEISLSPVPTAFGNLRPRGDPRRHRNPAAGGSRGPGQGRGRSVTGHQGSARPGDPSPVPGRAELAGPRPACPATCCASVSPTRWTG